MLFDSAHVKAVKADIAKKELTISFTIDLNDENLEVADQLSQYADKEQGSVELSITPFQISLFPPTN